MAERPESDWEWLLLKCATDSDYRGRLGSAIESGQDEAIEQLLTEIGVQGAGLDDLAARVKALRATYASMFKLYEEMEPDRAVAP